MSKKIYDTLAEIQRVCLFKGSTKSDTQGFNEAIAESENENAELVLVRDNGEGFTIHSNGIWYLVTDKKPGDLFATQTIYKKR